jgi:hypothetical protein
MARFDGQHFDSDGKLEHVSSLVVAPNGDFWIGTIQELKRVPASD